MGWASLALAHMLPSVQTTESIERRVAEESVCMK